MAISAQQPPLLLGDADARQWIRRRLPSSLMASPDNCLHHIRPVLLDFGHQTNSAQPILLDVLNKISMGVSGELVADDAAP